MNEADKIVEVIREAGYEAFAYTPTPEDVKAAGDKLGAEEQALTHLSGKLPPAPIDFRPSGRWNDSADPLLLLTPNEYLLVPDGTTLVCINGSTKVKGVDYIDQDTRFGCIAWGFLASQFPDVEWEG